MPTQTDYLNLSQAVYTTGGATPVAPSGWTLLQSETLPSGMQAAAFQNTITHEIVISYEGTNLNNMTSNFSLLFEQLSADAAIANGVNPQANIDALNFAGKVAGSAGGNPIYVTGHSLGGEEAEYVQAHGAANGLIISGGDLPCFFGPRLT